MVKVELLMLIVQGTPLVREVSDFFSRYFNKQRDISLF